MWAIFHSSSSTRLVQCLSFTPCFHPSLPQLSIATFPITLSRSFPTSTCMLNLLPSFYYLNRYKDILPAYLLSFLHQHVWWHPRTQSPLFPIPQQVRCSWGMVTPSHSVSSPYLNRYGDILSPNLLPFLVQLVWWHPLTQSPPSYLSRCGDILSSNLLSFLPQQVHVYGDTLSPNLLSFLPQQVWWHPLIKSPLLPTSTGMVRPPTQSSLLPTSIGRLKSFVCLPPYLLYFLPQKRTVTQLLLLFVSL